MRLPGRHVGFALAAAAVALSVSAVLPHRTLVPHAHAASAADEDQSFGDELVWAARWQTWIPVIYNPSYAQIPYPNGDVAWYYGVCTDVIVRAYRWMGIDLQVEVKRSGAGSGDTNIDHRRVQVLREFLKRKGQSLPVTDNPDDYLPGDIVSYYVPDGRFSKTHIAIVSDRKASSGAPLIIHNRGFGVQEEDRLFAEKITGHYRYWPMSTGSASEARE